jgi:hypothetical protein
MVASVAIKAPATITAPPGWTLIRNDLVGAMQMSSYWRAAGGAEPATYTWRFSVATQIVGGIVGAGGANVNAPIDVHNGAGAMSPNLDPVPITAPTVTSCAGCANALLVAAFSAGTNSAGAAFAPAGGMVEQWDVTTPAVIAGAMDTQALLAGGTVTGAKIAMHTHGVAIIREGLGHQVVVKQQ